MRIIKKYNQQEQALEDNSLWKTDDLGLLEIFSYRSFSVIKVIDWDEIINLSNKYIFDKNKNITSLNQLGNITHEKGESVPCQILDFFPESESISFSDHYNKGSIHLVSPHNLYKTMNDFIDKQLKIIYPDLILNFASSSMFQDFVRYYPQLVGNTNIFDKINYQYFNILGMDIFILKEESDAYYWYISDFNIRSLSALGTRLWETIKDTKNKKKIWKLLMSPSGNTTFKTIDEAYTSVKNYIEYFLYNNAFKNWYSQIKRG